ncbi:MAG: glycosyltransferase family 4 protein [Bacteroidales bacterium]|nr:glycosyltransferase family 4 protein [Bacteroidales bacterium]
MEAKKIKVVWICHLSNEEIRGNLHLRNGASKRAIKDYSQWNTNGINEFKKFNDIELHVISPHTGLSIKLEEFIKDGIHYHIFKSEDDYFMFRLKRKFLKGRYETPEYKVNCNGILSIVKSIKPDIIHVIGAENPEYSKSALSMPKDIPLIVALQTLMIDPEFFMNYPISKKMYDYRSGIERKILQRSDYISCRVQRFTNILKEVYGPDIKILDMPLILGEKIDMAVCEKEYDFVYFAKEIEKAVDWAIESFALAHERYPGITLNIVGGYAVKTKRTLDKRLEELGISDKVSFSGSLPTHDNVIEQVRKSRFALLPLKIDLISGTIREAMANGLPVVTTVTSATPKLNESRESILLSEKGNHEAMAENMLSLLSSNEFAESIRSNAFKTTKEIRDNEASAHLWRDVYYAVLENKNNGTPIPNRMLR